MANATLSRTHIKKTQDTAFPKKEGVSSHSSVTTRIPPHNMDAEQALLACCLLEGGQESMTACIEAKIDTHCFFKPAHQVIFQTFLELYSKGTPIDEIIICDALKNKGRLEEIGNIAYIHEITNRIDTTAHLPFYIERVRDLSLLRKLIATSVRTIEQAYQEQDDLKHFLEQVEQDIFKISENRITDAAKPIRVSIDNAVKLIQNLMHRKGELSGVSCGFLDLDKMTFGLHPQEMIVVAARPSMGKTSLALNIAEAAVLHRDPTKRVPTLFFSLEMSSEQLAMRLLCGRARVDMQKLKDGFLDREPQSELARVSKELREAPLWIDDAAQASILEMRAKARRLHSQKHLGLIIIDYLQLVSGTDTRIQREQQIAEISRGIKAMSKELNLPVVVLSQLNRESEKEKRQPKLSDLRESGSIEQDADLVLLLAKKKDSNDEEDMNSGVVLCDLIIAKQRNGPIGIVTLAFNRKLTRFENYTGDIE